MGKVIPFPRRIDGLAEGDDTAAPCAKRPHGQVALVRTRHHWNVELWSWNEHDAAVSTSSFSDREDAEDIGRALAERHGIDFVEEGAH